MQQSYAREKVRPTLRAPRSKLWFETAPPQHGTSARL